MTMPIVRVEEGGRPQNRGEDEEEDDHGEGVMDV